MYDRGKKVLLIDDNREIRIAYRKGLLLSIRCTVGEASNGLEGIMLAKEIKPDLIVLDYIMPEMDGGEFLHRLRHESSLYNVTVIMVTSENGKEEVLRLVSLGVRDYLVKPVQLVTIIERVVKIVGREYLLVNSVR